MGWSIASRARRSDRVTGRCLGGVACAVVLFGVVGCEETPAKNEREIRLDYIAKLKQGMDFGDSGMMSVESYDPQTLELEGIRIDDGSDAIARAERGELLIDVERDTLRIILHDVMRADAQSGRITKRARLETQPIPLEFDAVP